MATQKRTVRHVCASLLVLRGLGLSPLHLAALRTQGFVSWEQRGVGRPIAKLRYRVQGQQHVRYLGTDASRARTIEHALRQWQAPQRAGRLLQQAIRQAATALRNSKAQLIKELHGTPHYFHGYALRTAQDTGHHAHPIS